jgi:KUP system potassium uptake protein
MTAESQQAASGAESAATATAETAHYGHGHQSDGKLKLAVGAVGVVFGDIGTSPLYALKESFIGPSSAGVPTARISSACSR